MCAPIHFFRETHIVGRRCRELMLDAAHYPVLQKAPFVWIGYSVLRPPYRMVRLKSVHSHVVASVAGRGRALVDGKVVDWKPGQVLLAPVGRHHAFEVAGPGPWTIAWIFFDDTVSAPALAGEGASLVRADTEAFVGALRLLTQEAAGPAQASMLESLVSVLDTATRRMAGNDAVDQRLGRLWRKLEADLARPWTVADMARLLFMSEEHLRRLCQKWHQRSPAEHLAHLRMRRAGTMLRSSALPIEEIALKVGYASVYSFSVAFSRWCGVPPGRFRRSLPATRQHRGAG